MLFVMYATTAYSSFLSQWKFFKDVSALIHSGFYTFDFSVNNFIHGSLRASAAVILYEGCFCKSFLIKSLAALLT